MLQLCTRVSTLHSRYMRMHSFLANKKHVIFFMYIIGSVILHISGFNAVFTNLNRTGRTGPKSLDNHYAGQDHDGQVSLSRGIQLWTVPYSGHYRIEAIGAAGGYNEQHDGIYAEYRGRGARISGTFVLINGEIIQILVGQEGGKSERTSSGGGGSFVVKETNDCLVIAGGGGGVIDPQSRHAGCDASANTTGNPGYRSWSGGSNGHGSQTVDDCKAGQGLYYK